MTTIKYDALIAEIADEAKTSKAMTEAIITNFVNNLNAHLIASSYQYKRLCLPGFGTFFTVRRAARTVKTPGHPGGIRSRSRMVMRFYQGDQLETRIQP